jgi:hypothetical protein
MTETHLLGALPPIALPSNFFRYVWEASRWHQVPLVVLTVCVSLMEVVPLELQRRIVNDAVKNRDYRLVAILCGVYLGTVLMQGGTKLALNVYRNWVGERAVRELRRRVHVLASATVAGPTMLEAEGVQAAMIVPEVEPVGFLRIAKRRVRSADAIVQARVRTG